ncbi:sulfate ABC transporter ATP-binding protein [Acidisoma cellulosilytica]|uniref:Sulfate ABC transporter ATP-binding protein n=1 Tax=Acidisoma cellulosilyticum TaxID=2802395 RepID=A0A963Z6C5_9PROT|nr:sulfate ABC transporter ATP-binding protein [Acidisoma cellulosilyticum]MCB8883389.1 sulfate ABC transporter ATP-binding protein [Acidisoma cellulosilyticum]
MAGHVSIHNVSRRFGAFAALNDVSLDIPAGELVALLGPSGSGKTTLLRIIAGLDFPDSGQVLINGEDNVARHPRERGVGFVFQHYALFRHMTVAGNVAFGLQVRPRGQRPSKAEIKARVAALLDLVQLGWLADRYPIELSGGQRQRVALARALAIEPRLLLLDEPFGALDTKVRKELGQWLRDLHHGQAITSLLVTHDQAEALELADRIVLMSQGKVEQIGTPAELYTRPASPFVLEFLGEANRIPCVIGEGGLALLAVSGHALAQSVEPGQAFASPGAVLTLYVRPHDLVLEARSDGPAVVRAIKVAGAFAKIELMLGELALTALTPLHRLPSLHLQEGSRARLIAAQGMSFSAAGAGGSVQFEAPRALVMA